MKTETEVMTTCPFCQSNRIFTKYRSINIAGCKNCGLWFRYPFPSEGRLDYFYKQDYSAKNIKKGATNLPVTALLLAEGHLRKLQNELNVDFSEIRALDFGAGIGSFSKILKDKGAEVVAIERNENAQEIILKQDIEVLSNIDSLQPNSFDLVLCIEVIEHCQDPWLILRALYALLKPHGNIYISTLNRNGLNALMTRDQWREIVKTTHLYFFNRSSLEKIVESAGFKEIKKCNWVMDLRNINYRPRIRNIIQYGLQFLGLGGGLRLIAKKQ